MENIKWKRKGDQEVMRLRCHAGVPFLQFPAISDTGIVKHGFSTRLGGVSAGVAASMNLSAKCEDTPENVEINYRRMAAALEVEPERFVYSRQTHTTNVRVVTEEDAGKGFCVERDYDNVDGLVTDVPGITLVTHYADCVPLFFVDPVHRAIGLSHSGWRGTAGRMGKVTLETMAREYGTRPEDVIAAIGPSICRDCYEVSADVAEVFRELVKVLAEEGLKVPGDAGLRSPDVRDIYDEKENDKFQLDLWNMNRLILLGAGILPEHLQVTDLCTCCNPELLHSHRATKGRRGSLAGFLCLKEEE